MLNSYYTEKLLSLSFSQIFYTPTIDKEPIIILTKKQHRLSKSSSGIFIIQKEFY